MKLFNVKINVDLCKKNVGFSFLMKCGKCVHKGCIKICCKIKPYNNVLLIRKQIFLDFRVNKTSPMARRGFIFRSGT